MAPSPPGAPLGIYIHIPFCAHICPYCDFNTYAGQETLVPRYVEALVTDIARQGAVLGGRAAGTIFFGGGTPSLLEPSQVERIVTACRDAFAVGPDAEVTLEANPNSVDEAWFRGIREAGVNRLSLGVQTLDRRGLRTLGRQHEAADAQSAFLAARRAGFDNISLDLIFGWPGQTAESWLADLDGVLGWDGAGPEHLSLYSLIIEPGTPMADAVDRRILVPLDEDAAADRYEAAIARMAAAGWIHYEVANWARTPALQSQHNRVYWRNGEYVAAGAGAHGRVGDERVMMLPSPRGWIERIEAGESGISNRERLSPRTQMGESMMVGLRLLDEGVEDAPFERRHGCSLEEAFGAEIRDLANLGLLERLPDRVRLNGRGLMVANDVCARFLEGP